MELNSGEVVMSVKVEISLGELIDKLVILEIKENRITDVDKLKNIKKELETLRSVWNSSEYIKSNIENEISQLKMINEILWDIEDKIREKEASKNFDEEFIHLARQVYLSNDKRSGIKKTINEKLGSDLREVKSYTDYENKPDRK